MEDLIKAHGWDMQEQNLLEIKGSKYLLSVIPEYSYFTRDEHNKIIRSKTPQYLVLNCAILSPITMDDEIAHRPVMYINITSEEEFYDFMIELTKTVHEESKLPDLNNAV
jgi:hypothetical protein